ncbi:MAG: ABC transporter substrate-binding protein [Chloroflexi bacterium]|nr:ABC transporter substrate-binding protein [Chloroflexota bacterium]
MKHFEPRWLHRALLGASLALTSLLLGQSVVPVAAQDGPVKIGLLTPLSPPGDAAAGQLIVRGADLAAEYVNGGPGSALMDASCALPGTIEIVKADDAGTPQQGVAGLRKLAQDDGVAAVTGQFHSSVALAIQPVADQLQVPWISTQASDPRITSTHSPFSFQTHSISTDRAAAVADFIKTYGFTKVAVIAETTDYGTSNTEALKEGLAGSPDVTLKTWSFDNKTTDISPLLLQVTAFAPDLIYNLGVGAPAYLMIQQATDAGLLPATPMLVSYDLPIRPEFWQNVGDQGKGIIFVAYSHPLQHLTDAGAWMRDQYQERYSEPALYSSFAAFGNVLQLAQAVNHACSTQGPAIAAALEKGPLMSWNQADTSFPQADGADWHRVKQPLLLVQYTETNQAFGDASIIYPPTLKTADLTRP